MQRPGRVTAFGGLNISLGALGILGLIWSWIALFVLDIGDNPVLQVLETNAAYNLWTKVSYVLGGFATVALIVAGVGLLQMKPWSRKLSIGYSIYILVSGAVGMVISWFAVFRPLLDRLDETSSAQETAVVMGGILGGTFGSCFGMIYPIAILVFMTRPGFVAAFDPDQREERPPEPLLEPEVPAPIDHSNPYAAPATSFQKRPRHAGHGDDVLGTVIPYRNKPALIAYYLGIFSIAALIPILGVVGIGMAVAALVLGAKGLDEVKRHPESKGKVHAWIGVIGGSVFGLLGLLLHGVILYGVITN